MDGENLNEEFGAALECSVHVNPSTSHKTFKFRSVEKPTMQFSLSFRNKNLSPSFVFIFMELKAAWVSSALVGKLGWTKERARCILCLMRAKSSFVKVLTSPSFSSLRISFDGFKEISTIAFQAIANFLPIKSLIIAFLVVVFNVTLEDGVACR